MLPAHSDPVTAVDFSRDGQYMVSSSYDGLVRVWHTATGRCVQTLMDDVAGAPVGCVRFTANTRYALAASQDGCLRMWELRAAAEERMAEAKLNAKPMRLFRGTAGESFCASAEFCVHHAGGGGGKVSHLVAAGGDDGAVRFWAVSVDHGVVRERAIAVPEGRKVVRKKASGGLCTLGPMQTATGIGRAPLTLDE